MVPLQAVILHRGDDDVGKRIVLNVSPVAPNLTRTETLTDERRHSVGVGRANLKSVATAKNALNLKIINHEINIKLVKYSVIQ